MVTKIYVTSKPWERMKIRDQLKVLSKLGMLGLSGLPTLPSYCKQLGQWFSLDEGILYQLSSIGEKLQTTRP